MSKVMRYQIADYLETKAAADGGNGAVNSLMGAGFLTLDENPSAKVETTAYINNRSASGTITGYETVFPFDTQLISDEAAVKFIYDIARNQKTGTEAETNYYRVDLYDAQGEGVKSYPARRFKVAVEVTGITGAGTEIVRVAGNLHQVGDFTAGTFDIETKTFTPKAG